MRRTGDVGNIFLRVVVASFGLAPAALILSAMAWGTWNAWTKPPPTPEELAAQAKRYQTERTHREAEQLKLALCEQAAACKKYSEARLECATAGNFRTCLRIKMGDYASYNGTCSGYVEGAPAVPLPPETPNTVDCFFRTLLK
jgi:hypothetical protein